MYLEIFQYDVNEENQVEFVQEEIRDFINAFPRFKVVKTESFAIGNIITIHMWYKEI